MPGGDMGSRSKPEGSDPQPIVKVVGFHVEGAPSSPTVASLQGPSTEGHIPRVGSSSDGPDFVPIPPSFKPPPLQRRSGPAAAPSETESEPPLRPAQSSTLEQSAVPPAVRAAVSASFEPTASATVSAAQAAEAWPAPERGAIHGLSPAASASQSMTDQPGDAHMAKLRQTDATPTLAEGVAQAVRSAAGAAPAEAARADSRAGSRRSSIGQRESKGDAKAGSKGGESAGAPKGAGGDGGGKKAAQDERQGGAQPPPDLANMSKEERRAYYAAQRQQGALDTAPRKPQTKAERRALQEAQKAAKAAARAEAQGQPAKKGGSPNPDAGAKPKAPKPPSGASTRRSSDGEAVRADAAGAARSDQKAGGGVSGAVFGPQEMFAHLQPFDGDAVDKYILGDSQHSAGLPPEVLQLAMQYRSGAISGANARCVALLHVLRGVIASHVPSSERQIGKHLTDKVNRVVSFLVHFRPLSVSMGNAVRWLKLELGKVGLMDADEARAYLVGKIDTFIAERVEQADEEIVAHANDKIVDGDVILTHAYSHAVLQTLLKAKECGKKFRVVVVDSRPLHEGQRLLRELLANGIPCMFTHIGALNYIMGEATKTFLGAAAVLANGAAVSRVGTAAVAMISQSRKVPVLIFAETYKFHERIQLDSIISNELGDPKALLEFDGPPPKLVDMDAARAAAATPGSGLTLLNLTYDLMPADLITFVVTEYGLVPPTSVPVILREYRKEFSLTT